MTPTACLRPGGVELTDRLLAAAALRPRAAVLDVGCGDGASVAHLTDACGCRATGLDASAARIACAGEARPDLCFVTGLAEALPFAGASFDAVLCECVLSTVEDAGTVLAEMARVLRPGGALLASDVYARGDGKHPPASAPPTLGRRETVEALLAAAGLVVEVWEDQTWALGRYLWDLAGSRPPLPAPPPAARSSRSAAGRQLGYFISVARPSGWAEKGAS